MTQDSHCLCNATGLNAASLTVALGRPGLAQRSHCHDIGNPTSHSAIATVSAKLSAWAPLHCQQPAASHRMAAASATLPAWMQPACQTVDLRRPGQAIASKIATRGSQNSARDVRASNLPSFLISFLDFLSHSFFITSSVGFVPFWIRLRSFLYYFDIICASIDFA